MLAIIAWFAVDRMVAEEPQAAVAGGAYELVAKPNCRYASGECELVNNDFQIALVLSDDVMMLRASHALDSVQLALGDSAGTYGVPQALNGSGQSWQLALEGASPGGSIRVLASAGGASYYAETSLAFIGGVD
ncbi:MAG: hypothetical protein AAF229_03045 [Pseudomonadota bacterium]